MLWKVKKLKYIVFFIIKINIYFLTLMLMAVFIFYVQGTVFGKCTRIFN